ADGRRGCQLTPRRRYPAITVDQSRRATNWLLACFIRTFPSTCPHLLLPSHNKAASRYPC
ncbi:MAG: hypothetical protein QF723_06860, partial [Phycisphaerales bacterium]|nr:hypothetical protein [Phycisphaerales bacterium]